MSPCAHVTDFGESSVEIMWKITGSTSAGSGNDRTKRDPGSQASNHCAMIDK